MSQNEVPLKTLLDVIKNNQSISELNITTDRRVISIDKPLVKRLVAEHPALIQLELVGYRFTAENVFTIIRQLHSLKVFRFSVSESEYPNLIDGEDDGWILNDSVNLSDSNVRVELIRSFDTAPTLLP